MKKRNTQQTTPEGYNKVTVFLKPEFEMAITEMAKTHGLKKYYILNTLLSIYWERFESGMNSRIEKALECMREDLEKMKNE